MKLTVVGCSPAWPNPGGAQSGYLVEGEGRLLLDCGPGVLSRLRATEAWPRIDAIAITHFHLDHWGDLVPWVWGSVYGPGRGEAKPELWLPPGGSAILAELGQRLGSKQMFENAFRVREYAPEIVFAAAGFELAALPVEHYGIEAFGFRVEGSEATLGYSGDSAPGENLGRIAAGSDIFVCEATLLDGGSDGETRGHLSYDEAAAVGAAQLLVTHRPAELPLPAGVEAAHDGLVLEL